MTCLTFPFSSDAGLLVFSPQTGRFPLENVHVQDSGGGGCQGTVAPLRPHNHLYMNGESINVCLWGSNRDVT